MKAGWEASTLGQASIFQRGLTYSKADEVDFSDTAVLRANNIDLATNSLDLADIRYISDSVSVPKSKQVKAGSLIICTASGSKSHLGKVAYIDRDYGYAFGGFMAQINPNERLDPKFLYYALTGQAFADWLGKVSSGININNLKFSDIEHFPLSLPPLDEQRRIVAVLDKAFAGIATVVANAQKNLTNARALFESTLSEIFDQQGSNWPQLHLNEVGKTITGNTPKTADKDNFGDFLPFIKPGNFLPDGSIVYDGDGLSEKGAQSSRIVPAGSALMVCIGATIGKSGYTVRKVTANQQINAVIPKNGVSGKFLYYQFLTPSFQRSVRDGSGQATLPIISKSKWSNLDIRLPDSEAEQVKAVKTLDDISEKSQRLADVGMRKLAALTELKQSLLHKAFAGELT